MFGGNIEKGFEYVQQMANEIHALRLEIAKLTATLQSLQITGERDGEEQPFKITAEPIPEPVIIGQHPKRFDD